MKKFYFSSRPLEVILRHFLNLLFLHNFTSPGLAEKLEPCGQSFSKSVGVFLEAALCLACHTKYTDCAALRDVRENLSS